MPSLFTMPHTGTRFVFETLHYWNIRPHHEHFRPESYIDTQAFDKAIVTLRDPMLARISSLQRIGEDDSQYPIWCWKQAFRLADDPRIHFVRMQDPRKDELERLAQFCEADIRNAQWKDVGKGLDTHGWKARYLSGDIPDELKADAEMLRRIGATSFFREHGYSFPWMH